MFLYKNNLKKKKSSCTFDTRQRYYNIVISVYFKTLIPDLDLLLRFLFLIPKFIHQNQWEFYC